LGGADETATGSANLWTGPRTRAGRCSGPEPAGGSHRAETPASSSRNRRGVAARAAACRDEDV